MKKVADSGETAVPIPRVVEPIEVEVTLRAIKIEVSHVAIAIRIQRKLQSIIHTTAHRSFAISGLNLIRHRNALMLCAKYLHF